MHRLYLLGMVALILAGCKRQTTTTPAPSATGTSQPVAQQPAGGQTTMHAPTGVVINPGLGGGGSGGAVQAVRKAVGRTVQQHEMNNIRQFIENFSVGGQMPSVQDTVAVLQREAPATFKLVQEGDIILTGIRRREGIWAYTRDPQTVGGEHIVVTNSGVERLTTQVLQQRLQQGF